jgi:hypothetical protein
VGPSLSVGARCLWALVVRGRSLFVGGGSSLSIRARGWWWWVLVPRCGSRVVVVGVRSWSRYGIGQWYSGRSRVGVLLFVGGGSSSSMLGCCLLAPGGRCWWVGNGRSWVGDDRSWVRDGGGGGVMVGSCGSGVVVVLSVVVGPAVTFVGCYRRSLSLCPTPIALRRGAVVVVVVRIVVRA